MKNLINNFTYHHIAGFLFLSFILFMGGCTLDGINGDIANNSVTDQDLEAASQILGESLSSDNSGMILSLNDAVTTVSNDGFLDNSTIGSFQKTTGATLQEEDSGWGHESNYSYSYDPETGTHTVSFQRIISRPLFTKQVTDTLKYIFTDNNGAFIEFPRAEKERIESVDFKGYREGEVETPRKNSSFVRVDTFLVDGISNASSILQIDGVHNGEGMLKLDQTDGTTLERKYELEINFLNIEIDKTLAQGGLEQGVTGILSWEMRIENTGNGSSGSKTLSGTIEMNGDGTALLRFKKFLKVFQINLNDGDVKDQDREFEGRVTSVNLDRQVFTLGNGHEIFVNDQTRFDSDGYSTLRQVQEALNNGNHIWAEGEGTLTDNNFIASKVEFQNEDDLRDQSDDSHEFEDLVTAVNLEQSNFTLAGEVIIKIDDQTEIDADGTYQSLQEVNDALGQGDTVNARGRAEILETDSLAALRALKVSFNKDDHVN